MEIKLPELCICMCTYKRPWYAVQSINSLMENLRYSGDIRFHIADGGSNNSDIEYYMKIISGKWSVSVKVSGNLSDMCNSCAEYGGELWLTIMDDYILRYPLDITPDAILLLTHTEVGCVRMNRLSHWGNGGEDTMTSADLIKCGNLHWWRLDKSCSSDPYMSGIGVHLYHRRYWDFYGNIPACPPNHPGQAELNGNARFWSRPDGPTVAVPMRFGENYEGHLEPFHHVGAWRTDEYSQFAGTRL